MAQISRPFQVVLAAFALLVLVWFFALHRPGSDTSSSSSASSSPVSSHTHSAAAPAARSAAHAPAAAHTTTSIVHRAHTTVTTSKGRVVHHTASVSKDGVAHHTASASKTVAHRGGVADPHSTTASHPHSATHSANRTAPAAAVHAATGTRPRAPHKQGGSAAPAQSNSAPPMQAVVAAELKQGKVVLLLFWNQHSSNDVAVRQQVQDVAHKLGRRIAVHTASATQVGSFGSITRDIQVYQTPTLLIVTPKAQVTTVTGYTDAYALEQTIREARG